MSFFFDCLKPVLLADSTNPSWIVRNWLSGIDLSVFKDKPYDIEMKFTIAAAILTQNIPEIASLSSDEQELSSRPTSILGQAKRALLFQQAKPAENRFKTFEQAQGLLKNNPGLIGSVKTCDPFSSEDLDIGVLSCGSGYECLEDEASALGGFCMQTSRQLEEPTVYCDVCGYGQTNDFAIGKYQPVLLPTGNTTTCFDIAYFAYVDPIFTATTCPVFRSIAISAGCCFPYECPSICEDKKFLPYNTMPTGDGAAYCLGVVPGFDETECAAVADDVAQFCCEDGGTDTPVTVPPEVTFPPGGGGGVLPSTAPILPPGGGAPASDALWMFSTRTAMMGLATTITAAVMAIT